MHVEAVWASARQTACGACASLLMVGVVAEVAWWKRRASHLERQVSLVCAC